MNNIRILTSTSLFDGHDASINIMRRVLQEKGAEIIHFGHNRSAQEIVAAAIEEDVQGIAITSYQGGHIEFFTYVRKLLNEAGYQHIKIVGGGGGTILPKEAAYLEKIGISKIYLPEDGLKLGIEGMIEQVIQLCDYTLKDFSPKKSSAPCCSNSMIFLKIEPVEEVEMRPYSFSNSSLPSSVEY